MVRSYVERVVVSARRLVLGLILVAHGALHERVAHTGQRPANDRGGARRATLADSDRRGVVVRHLNPRQGAVRVDAREKVGDRLRRVSQI